MEGYAAHIEHAFACAEKGESKITQDIIDIHGMSGVKTRHLYNVIASMPDARYLEIGTWKGSTVCAAMCGNKATVTCIDNWSQFGGPKSEFLVNFSKFRGENTANFIEHDCFTLPVDETLPKYNIYMYDGDHTDESHMKALLHFHPCLDSTFIYIVDDWNWQKVRDGTQRAIEALHLKVLYSKMIRTSNDDSVPPDEDQGRKDWWNGIYVAVLQK